jgi:hypothetical protein
MGQQQLIIADTITLVGKVSACIMISNHVDHMVSGMISTPAVKVTALQVSI